MKQRGRIIFFAFIAILMLSEMIGSNLWSLIGPLEDTAKFMGVSVAEERVRLIILIILDAIPGIGALLAVQGYRRSGSRRTGRNGVIITTFGMLAYGSYQFTSAIIQLGDRQSFVMLVGVVYASLGVAAWFIGSDLRQEVASPDALAEHGDE
jgi:hypothetical protein